jgi:hypothetical protein
LVNLDVVQADPNEAREIKLGGICGGGNIGEIDTTEIKSAASTTCRASSAEVAPAYMPRNCGWLSSMMHFSIKVVANGQPKASIAFCANFCNPSRATVKAGSATIDLAVRSRSVIAAMAPLI